LRGRPPPPPSPKPFDAVPRRRYHACAVRPERPAIPEIAPLGAQIAIDRAAIADFCRRHHIRRLSLFGSVLRHDFRPDSDVDVLVEFEPGRTPGLAFFSMQDELSGLLGRKVDLHTPNSISRYFRSRVLAEAEPIPGQP
jgi:hypothetical protein